MHARIEDGIPEIVAVPASMIKVGRGSEKILRPYDDAPFEQARGAAVYLDEEALAEEFFEKFLEGCSIAEFESFGLVGASDISL